MKEEFVPYDLAIRLRRLGFDEPCFATFFSVGAWQIDCTEGALNLNYRTPCEYSILAPTFSQAFKWFRDKHDLVAAILPFQDIEDRVSLCYYYSIVDLDECKDEDILCNESSLGASDINFSSHPEAELACLNKLIEIVENI